MSARRSAALALVSLVLLAAAIPGCRRRQAPPPASSYGEGPRLVVIVVADQFLPEYFERFAPLWSGGVRRLLDEGAVFADAHHAHAVTATAAGHATLATGRFPSRHAIVANRWYDRGERQVVVAAEVGEKRSPGRLRASTLGDWAKRADRRARAFAASGKDRGALFLAGREADAAFWLDEGKRAFATARHYRWKERAWQRDFARREGQAAFAEPWQLQALPGEPASYGIEAVDEGAYAQPFPRATAGLLLSPEESFWVALEGNPASDELLERFVERLVSEEGLGASGAVDFLGVSFSALDYVGHDAGPASREVADTLLRLDRTLGRLLDFLESRVGREGLVVAFSSDHGVAPLPEQPSVRARGGRRIGTDEVLCFQRAGLELAGRHGDAQLFASGLSLDHERLRRRGLEPAAVAREAAELLRGCPGVERIVLAEELRAEAAASDPQLALFRNSFVAERSPDLYVLWQENVLPQRFRGTNHGTPWPHDTHVPLVVRAPGLAPQRIAERVRTVDLAPTLAALAGLAAPPDLDGRDLAPLLRRTPTKSAPDAR